MAISQFDWEVIILRLNDRWLDSKRVQIHQSLVDLCQLSVAYQQYGLLESNNNSLKDKYNMQIKIKKLDWTNLGCKIGSPLISHTWVSS